MKNLVIGNWKMHKTVPAAVNFVRELIGMELDHEHVEAVICPAYTALHAVRAALGDAPIGLGAQNMHWAEAGAFTGEISPPMLLDCGVQWVLLGHSERRAAEGELDEKVNLKVRAALAHGLTPIVAVGETKDEHERGMAHEKVTRQTRAAFESVPQHEIARCVVAYEPIWAIGSGTSDHPEGANDVMGTIRGSVAGLRDARLLYGGSVKPENIASFVAQPHINGALVGGASLDPASFAALVRNAKKGLFA